MNIFCITVVSYLMHHTPFPIEKSRRGHPSLHDRVIRQISRTIIPLNGTAFKYINLIQPKNRVSPQPHLRDIWALSTSILTEKAHLRRWEGASVVPGYDMASMRESVMIKAVASDAVAFHLGAYYPEDGPAVFKEEHFRKGTPAATRKAIYDRMVYSSYHEEHDLDVSQKLARRGLSSDRTAVYMVHDNYGRLHHKLPRAARYTQFALLYNALMTDRRYRRVSGRTSYPCHLCDDGEDSIEHIWECQAVIDGWAQFSSQTGYKLSTSAMRAKDRHHLFNLVFQGKGKTKEVNAICIFNWAVWAERQRYFRWLDEPPEKTKVSGIICESALLRLADYERITRTTHDKQTNKIQNYLVEREKLLDLIEAIPSFEAVCYTDGSALGNPGPSGAGAALTYPGTAGPALLEGSTPLGFSTNNVGELWALAMAIQMLEHKEAQDPTGRGPSALHIFSDSMYAIGLVKGNVMRSNIKLGTKVASMISTRRLRAPVTLHWVKGHLGTDGNEQADLLAKMAARVSRNLSNININDLIDSGRFFDPGGYINRPART